MKRFISSSLAVRIAIAVAAVIALAYIVTHAAVPVGTGLSSPVMTNFNSRYFTITLASGTTPTNVIQLNLPMGPGSPDLPGDIINIVNGTNLWTNDFGNLRPRVVQTQLNATNIVSHQNLVSQGAFDITTTYSGNLIAGSNSVPVLNNSYILLSSDFAATDPALRTIYLSGLAAQGQLLFLENILGNGGTTTSAFQLTNGTVCYDNPGMTVALQNGSWASTNAGESLFLQFDGLTGWREVSRFFGPLGGSGNSLWTNDAGILHPKDLTLPVMITNQLQFGPGTTNIIYRSGDMIVISNQTPHLKLEGLGGSFEFSWDLNTANISASGGANTVVGGPLESQTHFPGASSIYDLGLNNNIGWWRSLWQRGTNFNNAIPWNLTNYYRAADYMDGGTKVFDIQSWTNGAAGPVVGFSFRTNGVEVFNVTGTGGPSSGANWVASGTTNSTLAGTETVTNALVVAGTNTDSSIKIWSPGHENTLGGMYSGAAITTPTAPPGDAWGLTAWGFSALAAVTTGEEDSAFGDRALASLTIGDQNNAFGADSLFSLTVGSQNSAFGVASQYYNVTNWYNTSLGAHSLENVHSDRNSAFGVASLGALTSGYYNTAMGYSAGSSLQTGSLNVFLGNQAGYYETGDQHLWIDNTSRASLADGRVKALVYGTFDADPANQRLVFNALVGVNTNAPSEALEVLGKAKATAFFVAGTTNQVIFGATNTAPVSSAAPTKWISVQVQGEAAVYRLPLYE